MSELSEGELLEAAGVPAEQPAIERLCEAHFYIGSLRLIESDRDGAVQAFRQCIEQGATSFYEHHSARSELRALGEDL